MTEINIFVIQSLLNLKNDPHICWTILGTPEKFQVSSTGFKSMTTAMQCSALSNWPKKPLRYEQVTLLGSCVPVKGTEVQQTFLSPIIPFMGTQEPNKLTCSHISSFIVQLVRVLHRHCRRHGFTSFFRCTCEAISEIVQQVWGSQIHLSTTLHKHFFHSSFLSCKHISLTNWLAQISVAS